MSRLNLSFWAIEVSRNLMICPHVTSSVVFSSAHPSLLWPNSPAILRTPSGRLLVTFDVTGREAHSLLGDKTSQKKNSVGFILASDDNGKTWRATGRFPFKHGIPFLCKGQIYIFANDPDLVLFESMHDGENWTGPYRLTSGQRWHGASTPVIRAADRIWISCERYVSNQSRGWNVAALAPTLVWVNEEATLTDPERWNMASGPTLQEALGGEQGEGFGIPFYNTPLNRPLELAPNRLCSAMGWLEGNLVHIHDPSHCWHDQTGLCLHLVLRTNLAGGSGYAGLLRGVRRGQDSVVVDFQKCPSGRKLVLFPFPGGHHKFFIVYDAQSRLYWLATNQSIDSLCQVQFLRKERYNLPNNERHRLALYFSKNCFDWCFAGLVARGETELESRHYPSMIVDGDDLLVVCRGGNARSKNAQYSHMILFFKVTDFRKLIY